MNKKRPVNDILQRCMGWSLMKLWGKEMTTWRQMYCCFTESVPRAAGRCHVLWVGATYGGQVPRTAGQDSASLTRVKAHIWSRSMETRRSYWRVPSLSPERGAHQYYQSEESCILQKRRGYQYYQNGGPFLLLGWRLTDVTWMTCQFYQGEGPPVLPVFSGRPARFTNRRACWYYNNGRLVFTEWEFTSVTSVRAC